jgi:hypothetical protein
MTQKKTSIAFEASKAIEGLGRVYVYVSEFINFNMVFIKILVIKVIFI